MNKKLKYFLISFLLIGGGVGEHSISPAYAQTGNIRSADSIFVFMSMAGSDTDSVNIIIPNDLIFNIVDTVRLDSPLEFNALTR